MRFNLSAIAVRERAVTLFFIILLAAAGAYAFLMLGRAEDPNFTIKTLTVTAVWPGATAREMQDLVAEPLEKPSDLIAWVAAGGRQEAHLRDRLTGELEHQRVECGRTLVHREPAPAHGEDPTQGLRTQLQWRWTRPRIHDNSRASCPRALLWPAASRRAPSRTASTRR